MAYKKISFLISSGRRRRGEVVALRSDLLCPVGLVVSTLLELTYILCKRCLVYSSDLMFSSGILDWDMLDL